MVLLMDLSFVSNSKSTGDYFQEINGYVICNNFLKVLPKLKENAEIVIDNAPCHNMSYLKHEVLY